MLARRRMVWHEPCLATPPPPPPCPSLRGSLPPHVFPPPLLPTTYLNLETAAFRAPRSFFDGDRISSAWLRTWPLTRPQCNPLPQRTFISRCGRNEESSTSCSCARCRQRHVRAANRCGRGTLRQLRLAPAPPPWRGGRPVVARARAPSPRLDRRDPSRGDGDLRRYLWSRWALVHA